jgi:hypothetical protein
MASADLRTNSLVTRQADKYVLHLLAEFDDAVRRSYDSFAFHPGEQPGALCQGAAPGFLADPVLVLDSDEGDGHAAQPPLGLLHRYDARLALLGSSRPACPSGREVHLPGGESSVLAGFLWPELTPRPPYSLRSSTVSRKRSHRSHRSWLRSSPSTARTSPSLQSRPSRSAGRRLYVLL